MYCIDRLYHRLVKTTPNPKATKNNRGELVGPLPPPPPPVELGVGDGMIVDPDGADMVDVDD